MKRQHEYFIVLVFAVLQLACSEAAYPRQVVKNTDSSKSLDARWEWAEQQVTKQSLKDGYWIGYSISKLMGKHSFIGSYSSDRRKNKPSLREVISGISQADAGLPGLGDEHGDFEGSITLQEDEQRKEYTLKEIGILFHFSGSQEIDEAKVSNLSLHVKLGGDPLLWLGNAQNDESIDLLASMFRKATSDEAKKEIIMAAGVHPPTEKAFQFLKGILLGSERSGVREDAAFWMGEGDFAGALPVLEQSAREDRSADVREKAVFAISQMKGNAGTESLIRLARKAGEDDEMRKKAIFWLGQKATRKAVAALKDITIDGENTEIQKSAVFALSQLPDDEGIEPMIKIATTHANPKIRKEAIFWLSQSEDPRALEALVSIVHN